VIVTFWKLESCKIGYAEYIKPYEGTLVVYLRRYERPSYLLSAEDTISAISGCLTEHLRS
jgi:hypothetical protein